MIILREEQREFGRKQKLKRKQERAAHNAEMHANKAAKLSNEVAELNSKLVAGENKMPVQEKLAMADKLEAKAGKLDKYNTAALREGTTAVKLEDTIRKGKEGYVKTKTNRGAMKGVIRHENIPGNINIKYTDVVRRGPGNSRVMIESMDGKVNDIKVKNSSSPASNYSSNMKNVSDNAKKTAEAVRNRAIPKPAPVPAVVEKPNNPSTTKPVTTSSTTAPKKEVPSGLTKKVIGWAKRNKKGLIGGGLALGAAGIGTGVYLKNKDKE